MYSDKVMDHFKNPRNVGEIENADGIGEVGNPVCGDIMKIFLKIYVWRSGNAFSTIRMPSVTEDEVSDSKVWTFSEGETDRP